MSPKSLNPQPVTPEPQTLKPKPTLSPTYSLYCSPVWVYLIGFIPVVKPKRGTTMETLGILRANLQSRCRNTNMRPLWKAANALPFGY